MRTTSAMGVVHLEKGDQLMVIASTSGNVATTNTETEVQGHSSIPYTSWIITRIVVGEETQSPSPPSYSSTATKPTTTSRFAFLFTQRIMINFNCVLCQFSEGFNTTMRTEINETMLNSPDFRIEIIPINEDICQVTFLGPLESTRCDEWIN